MNKVLFIFNSKAMKKMIFNLLIFVFPLLLLLGPNYYVLFSSKENFHNIDGTIHNFENQKYLIGYLYNEDNYRYIKYKALSEKKATVVALGSSRVLPFRKEMFEADFYNAGFAVDNVRDFQGFLSCIPEKNLPDYLILGLDQWMFNDAWNDATERTPKPHWTKNNSFDAGKGVKKTENLYPDLFTGQLSLSMQTNAAPSGVERIGLNALLHSTGFRNDGSAYYGELIQKLMEKDTSISDYNFRNTFRRINNGNERFQFGNQVSEKALTVLNQLLVFCKSNKIQVIGFIPPFADAVYTKMKNSGNYEYMEKLYPALKPIFNRHDFEIYGYDDVSSVGSSDLQTTDGFHGGENTYVRIMIDMLRNKSSLNKVSKLEKLEKDLNTAVSNYVVYPY